ncbi:hypothetical protein AB0I68_33220 [Streptomyces sp. NPDC050448]|uniref:hypothetical protein n=1 Tax=Streptomyces sp. NPDC050448 TaxID=3155404 RepID=UPI0034426F0B
MPFTALHAGLGRLNATLHDLGHNPDWSQLRKARPRPPLTCPECEWRLPAKLSKCGVRYLCHAPGRPPVELVVGAPHDHMLKLEMVTAIREAG